MDIGSVSLEHGAFLHPEHDENLSSPLTSSPSFHPPLQQTQVDCHFLCLLLPMLGASAQKIEGSDENAATRAPTLGAHHKGALVEGLHAQARAVVVVLQLGARFISLLSLFTHVSDVHCEVLIDSFGCLVEGKLLDILLKLGEHYGNLPRR